MHVNTHPIKKLIILKNPNLCKMVSFIVTVCFNNPFLVSLVEFDIGELIFVQFEILSHTLILLNVFAAFDFKFQCHISAVVATSHLQVSFLFTNLGWASDKVKCVCYTYRGTIVNESMYNTNNSFVYELSYSNY